MIKWLLLPLLISFTLPAAPLKIGTKRFTESYILGEILKQRAKETGVKVNLHPGLGNTGIAFAALLQGSIDLYPEYTGTIAYELLHLPLEQAISLENLNSQLEPLGIGAALLLGFNNTYGLSMREKQAQMLGIHTISDLSKYPQLKLGVSQEFLKRKDGWDFLKKMYGLPQQNVLGMDHALSYEALANGQVDVIDTYSTDPKIDYYALRYLEDDRHFFPSYDALVLYRLDVPLKFSASWNRLATLENSITNAQMTEMNRQAEIEGMSFETVARRFLTKEQGEKNKSLWALTFKNNFSLLARQHLFLVFGSLLPAILIGVPLGIMAAYSTSLRPLFLILVGVIQTIPSLALFAFLIPILHQIGTLPAIIALFLYALLPIVRNTYTGLSDISKPLKESAIVLGLSLWRRLALIEIPLASRTILAGIKTAAIINVGMATIAAFIGAGGFGERIVAGLAVNNPQLLLSGAIPASLLAIIIHLFFDFLDHWLVPRGLISEP